jgi:hypothetical protein
MDQTYFDTIKAMESANVDRDYVLGWIGGYLDNPEREEQRVNEAYEAGREDGSNKATDGYQKWTKVA